MTAAFAIAALWLLCSGIIAVLCITAPEGWQGADGFHHGRPEDQQEARLQNASAAGGLRDGTVEVALAQFRQQLRKQWTDQHISSIKSPDE